MVGLTDKEQPSYFCDQSVNIFVFFEPTIEFFAKAMLVYVES